MKSSCEQALPFISQRPNEEPTSDNPLLMQDLQNGLCVLYAIEQNGQRQFLHQQDLQAAQLSFDELQQIGMRNLRQNFVASFKLMQLGPMYFWEAEHPFAASALLLDEMWEREFLRHVERGFMLALPGNNILAFCDSKSEEGIAALQKYIDQASARAKPLLSQALYRRQLGKWLYIENKPAPVDDDLLELRRNLQLSAEVARDTARKVFQREVNYDLEGIRWADEWLDLLHESSNPSTRDTTLQVLTSFVGECIIRNIGGEWGRNEGMVWVRFDDKNGAFPYFWVVKHLDNGKEAGDSVLGKYESMLAMRPKRLSPEQLKLQELYQAAGNYQIFIPTIGGSSTPWQRLSKLENGWLWGDDPRISTALHTLTQYYVTGAQGELICFAGALSDLPTHLQGKTASSPAAHQIAQFAAKPRLAELLNDLRHSFAAQQTTMTQAQFASSQLPIPACVQEQPRLAEILKRQWQLHKEGRMVWGALVPEDGQATSNHQSARPALMVYSIDTYFDALPHELQAIAEKIGQLQSETPADQATRELLAGIRADMQQRLNWPVPAQLSTKKLRATSFIVFAQHLPQTQITTTIFPLLIHPATPAVMILPAAFWSQDLLTMWQQGSLV